MPSLTALRRDAAPAAPPRPSLLLWKGRELLAEVALDEGGQRVLGRTLECDLTVPHDSVSRTHARLYADGGSVFLEDLGAVNGTFVDGRRVVQPVALEDGATVELGRSGEDGFRLRFEDPAFRLLRDMGLVGGAEDEGVGVDDETAGALDAPAGEAPPADPQELAGAESARENETAADPVAAGERGAEEAAGGIGRALRNPFLWAAAAFLMVLAVSAVAAFSYLQPASLGWRFVHLSPPEVTAGSELLLESPDVDPGRRPAVFLEGREIDAFTLEHGRLRLTVPDFEESPAAGPGVEAGRYELLLQVRQLDVEVFRTPVAYLVLPRIDRLSPASAVAGDEVTVHGAHFRSRLGPPQVGVGGAEAEVLATSAAGLRFRVPRTVEVDLGEPARLPVTVTVGRWQARSPEPLEVFPPPPPEVVPEEPPFRPVKVPGGWELRGPLGPALFYAGAGRRPPARVRRAAAAWNRLFELAPQDPELELVSVSRALAGPAGGGVESWALVASSPSLPLPLELGRWSAAELRRMAAPRHHRSGKDVPPGLLLHWLADAFRHLVDALGRGAAPAAGESSHLPAAFLAALDRVAELRTGGTWTPDAGRRVAAALGVAERGALAAVLGQFPPELADVAGRWSGRVENVFFPEDGYLCHLDLELRRPGRGILAGTARLTFRKDDAGIEIALPAVEISGSISEGLEPRVAFDATFARPVGPVRLEGVFAGSRLDGALRGPRLEVEQARWRAERAVDPADAW